VDAVSAAEPLASVRVAVDGGDPETNTGLGERARILDILLPPDEDDGEALEPVACRHPDDAIEDRSTLGEERYHCTACGSDFPHHPRRTNPEE